MKSHATEPHESPDCVFTRGDFRITYDSENAYVALDCRTNPWGVVLYDEHGEHQFGTLLQALEVLNKHWNYGG